MGRTRVCLDQGWRFAFGHAADPVLDFGFGVESSLSKAGGGVGALAPDFDDASWRELDLPHDWAIELPFVPGGSDGHFCHGFKPVGRPYPETSIGWYRRRFFVLESELGRVQRLVFDSVFRDCQVWLNGYYVGRNLSGYAGFEFDVSDVLFYGGDNVLVVRVDATQYEGWFYEGAGIYRHVWLESLPSNHINRELTSVNYALDGDWGRVEIEPDVYLENRLTQGSLTAQLVSALGETADEDAIAIDEFYGPERTIFLRVRNPLLWELGGPNLYSVRVSLVEGNDEIDKLEYTIGFREIEFDKDHGVILNGRPIKIKGACCHHDHAGVGAAVPDGLHEWRVRQLQKWGFNALRTSHNPPCAELLDACDRLGMLVLDETRTFGSSQEALSQLEWMVRRDRHHPCVIAWSIGNEEAQAVTEAGERIARTMTNTVHELDLRPVTYASNHKNDPRGANSVVDLRGFNYIFIGDLDAYREEHPQQFLWGTEEASTLCTRGEYRNDPEKGYMEAYDRNEPGWGATAEAWWSFVANKPWFAGAFVWTGFDYRGEPTPYKWPCISSHFGVLDTCGFPKDNAWYYKAWWTDEPVLHLFPHWNWPGREGEPIDVWCHTNHEEVELSCNGQSFGRQRVERNRHVEWAVPYQPGWIEAVGYRDGKEVGRARVETTGPATQLRLAAEPASALSDNDLWVVTVSGLDEQGRLDPLASAYVSFQVEGEGRILGVGNGDPSCHEPDQCLDGKWGRSLFHGLAQVIVRAGRRATLVASAQGLEGATVKTV